MDVARAPMGYRDVPSGRASVAGEFARVARLHRARMRGKPFWFLLWRLTKGTRPRGRNKKYPSTPKRRVTPKQEVSGPRVRGTDGFAIGAQGQEPSPIPNEKMPFLPDRETAFFLEWTALPAFAEGFLATAVMPTRNSP